MEADTRRRYLDDTLEHGRETMVFEGLKPGMRHWRADDLETSIAFAEVRGARVAVGLPTGSERHRADAMARFAADAAKAKRRVSFFGAEAPDLPGWRSLPIGEQPTFSPAAWPETLARQRGLREQLRRAKKKGVTVRAVDPAELAPGRPLREDVEALARTWLASRHMEPLRFVVAVEPFTEPHYHHYLLAERRGRPVAFLSAVPIPARHGWLIEDVFRDTSAPNGTTELLIDAFMTAHMDAEVVTLGLAPLTGRLPFWLKLARFAMRPLYDFEGLARFKRRLHPRRWEPVWLVHRHTFAPLSLVPVLRAFAGGSLVRFAARSLIRHPSGPPFMMALPLAPWTALLATLAATGHADLFGFSATRLWGWAAFDLALMVVLWLAALKPRPGRLLLALSLASVDAAASVAQLAATGLGETWLEASLRLLATLAPVLGAGALTWAWRKSLAGRRARAVAASAS